MRTLLAVAVLVIACERVGMPRLVEDQGQMGIRERDLCAACKARFVVDWSLCIRVAHASGVSIAWLNNR